MRGRACASFGGLCSREVPIESSAILSGGRAGERETVVINFESASGECLTLLDSQAGDIADQLEVPGARTAVRGNRAVPYRGGPRESPHSGDAARRTAETMVGWCQASPRCTGLPRSDPLARRGGVGDYLLYTVRQKWPWDCCLHLGVRIII